MQYNTQPVLKIFLCILHLYIQLNPAFASDRIEIPSSPNPVGSGARALGMGGAFIAIADDATAASWNPGGLIQLERPEISLVWSAFHRTENNEFHNKPDSSGSQTVSENRLNYISAALPFNLWDRNMVVSVSCQNLYDFTRKWNFPLIRSGENWSKETVDYKVTGSLSAIGIAYALQISRRFSFGFTLNIWEDGLYKNEWENKLIQKGFGVSYGNRFIQEIYSLDKYSFSGFNSNFGILWNVSDKFTFGAVFKTPFEADLDHDESSVILRQYPDLASEYEFAKSDISHENATLDMPMSYGIGFAYRFSDNLTASLDIYRTEWDDFILTDSEGETSPITGKSASESAIDPTYQVRMGAEYLFITSKYLMSLCGGLFYDPAPAEGSPDNFFGFSLGTGIGIKQFNFNIAYQYRFSNNVGDSILKAWGLSQDVKEHMVYSSVVIHF